MSKVSILDKICGAENFTIWNEQTHTFGSCFEKLCINVVAHALLAIISSFHFSRHHRQRIKSAIPQQHVINLRFAITALLAIIPLVLVIISIASHKLKSDIIDYLSWSVSASSFLIHSGFVWRLRRYYHIHIRGPASMVFGFLTTTVALGFHLYNIIVDVASKKDYVNAIEEYAAYIKGALHLAYLITLIPSKRPDLNRVDTAVQGNINPSINFTDSEQQPLLVHHIPAEQPLGRAEDGKGFFSRLFFIWASPLMYKGYKNIITGVEDLFELPAGLKTDFIEAKFKDTIRSQQYGTNLNTNQQCRDYANNSNEFSNGESVTTTPKPLSIIRALNKAFGIECWSLGVLKFLGDSLNFAGPILLNYLVSYMENSKELTWHGYIYATGLFLSTFLSSMFSIHFGYRISILGLKVRAALITTVYRKALSVNTVSLSTFSTGQVVNFMSTDTDRIVNFAPSFHQFWSLPIQVAISLYLLYSQVGLAFLAGLGFAVLLIPINR